MGTYKIEKKTGIKSCMYNKSLTSKEIEIKATIL